MSDRGAVGVTTTEPRHDDLPTREQLMAVFGAAARQGDAQGMHDALALLAIVSPKDAAAILAVIEARSRERGNMSDESTFTTPYGTVTNE